MENPRLTEDDRLSCEQVRDLMFLVVTNDLDEKSAEQAFVHLAGCPACRQVMAEHVKLAAALFGTLRKE
ncbi:MAG: zf-HC2 domain-containing protein [Armatimonadetes bacterium]|nr:zf-HC2 domain-containing protein [Armatimonadota bacterium]